MDMQTPTQHTDTTITGDLPHPCGQAWIPARCRSPPRVLPLVPSGLLRGTLCNPKSFKRRRPTTGNLSETWGMNLARRRRQNPTDVKHPFSTFGLWLPLRLALCLCPLHRPLFFVVSGMLHTSSPKRPARAADCFLTHISETDPAPARHQLSPQIPPADTDTAPAAPPRPFLQSAVLATNLRIVRGLSSAEILFLDSVGALHPTSSGADLFGRSPVRVPPTSSGGTFSAGTGTIGGRLRLCLRLCTDASVSLPQCYCTYVACDRLTRPANMPRTYGCT